MKDALYLPVETSGIADARKFIINDVIPVLYDVNTVSDIQNKMLNTRLPFNKYKYCAFDKNEEIPYFFKIKDKLSNGYFEFEIERITFKDAPIENEEKKKIIEQKYLLPLQEKIKELINRTVYLVACEKLGDDMKDNDFINLKIEKDKLDEEIKKFDYQKYLDEIV